VTVLAVSFVSWFWTVTVAPGTAAWLGSVTCPLMVARNSWAATLPAQRTSTAARRPRNGNFVISSPPLSISRRANEHFYIAPLAARAQVETCTRRSRTTTEELASSNSSADLLVGVLDDR